MKSARVEMAVVLVIAILLITLGVAVGAPKQAHDDGRLTSFGNGRRALRALHLLLDEVGAHPSRRLAATTAADPTDQTVVLAAPVEPVTRREARDLLDWVAAGGRLVIVAGPIPAMSPRPHHAEILDAAGLGVGPAQMSATSGMRFHLPTLREGLDRIEWDARWAVLLRKAADPRAGAPQTLLSNGTDLLVVRVPFGATENASRGEILVLADGLLFDNESLRRADNSAFAVRLLLERDTDGGHVVFDEIHHGFRSEGTQGHIGEVLLSHLHSTWPGRAALLLAFAGLVYFAGAMVRLGAPEREKPPPRRALSEHAEALGRIFESARARAETLHILAAGARRVIAQRMGITAALAPAEFARRLEASPAPGAAEVAAALRVADGPRPVRGDSDAAMARIAANLAATKRRFLHGGD